MSEPSPEKPATVDPDTLAKAIVKLSAAATALSRSGLNTEAVVILLHHETKLPQRDIRRIFSELESLARKFTVKT